MKQKPQAQSEYREKVTGAILAGGNSSRFGSDKALLTIDNVSLIERTVQHLRQYFNRIMIVTDNPEKLAFLSNVTIIKDVVSGLGPMGGIYSGLKAITGERALFMACDMPRISAILMEAMLRLAGEYDAVVPAWGDKVETTFAIYSKQCLGAFEELIQQQRYKLKDLFPLLKTSYVDILKLGLKPEIFFNINRPEDLKRYLRLSTEAPQEPKANLSKQT